MKREEFEGMVSSFDNEMELIRGRVVSRSVAVRVFETYRSIFVITESRYDRDLKIFKLRPIYQNVIEGELTFFMVASELSEGNVLTF